MEINKEVFLTRLNAIAKELNVPLKDEVVIATYFKRYPGVSSEIADEVFPMYGFKYENRRPRSKESIRRNQ